VCRSATKTHAELAKFVQASTTIGMLVVPMILKQTAAIELLPGVERKSAVAISPVLFLEMNIVWNRWQCERRHSWPKLVLPYNRSLSRPVDWR